MKNHRIDRYSDWFKKKKRSNKSKKGYLKCCLCCYSSVANCVQLFATPWTTACQVHLSFTISQRMIRLMSTESVMLSNHLILCGSLLLLPSIFPCINSFPMSQLFTSIGQCIGASASASVLPMNIQGWFPLELIGLMFLQCKGLSRVFFSTTVWKHQLFGTQPSLWSNSHIYI